MRRLMLLVMLVLFAAVPAFADDAVGFTESFEDESALKQWDGGVIDDSSAADGIQSLYVENPYGEESDGRISHILSYNGTVSLESGTIYQLSMDIINFSAYENETSYTGIRFGDGKRNIVFEFGGGNSESWTELTQFFIIPDNYDYSFSIELKNGGTEVGFLVDNISLKKIDVDPENLIIQGRKDITIPAEGEISVQYRLGAYTENRKIINILQDISEMRAIDMPAGVSFDNKNNTVTVSEYCPDNTSFVLECSPPEFLTLEPVRVEVTLTRNILKDTGFSDVDNNWVIEPNWDINGGKLVLYTEIPCRYGSMASLKPTKPVMLIGGVMYVLRAKVRVEGSDEESVYSQNSAIGDEGSVVIDILDLPEGDAVDVIAAFTPENSGIYDIIMNFVTTNDGAVQIETLSISPESPEETFITLHAPGNIAVPDTTTEFPFGVYVRDQAGTVISSRCDISIYPEGRGVEIANDTIIVHPDAMSGEYLIKAISKDNTSIGAELSFEVSSSNIGDGGFEEHKVNEWWMAASPAVMRIEDYAEGKFARISSDDDFAFVLNNSYMHLYANYPYVFSGNIVRGNDQTVTVFIETLDGKKIPLVQASGEEKNILELFQPENEMVGRLILYISSESGGINIGLDDLKLFRAVVSVSGPTISGMIDSGASVTASFSFINNIDDSADSSDCAISWYTYDPATGETEQIGSGTDIIIPGSAVGKQLYYEIVPTCKLTGFSGDTMRSVPVSVGSSMGIMTPDTQLPNNNDPVVEELRPIALEDGGNEDVFEDVEGHWAQKYISALHKAGAVNGIDEKHFCPDEKITRAELAAVVSRAFNARGGTNSFTDVDPESWYGGYVASVSACGLMNGTGDDRFMPDEYVTREQLAVVMINAYEALGYKAKLSDISRFYDHGEISSWAVESVEKGLNIGIVNGTIMSTFVPLAEASRGEACTMLARLLERIAEED